MIISQVVDAALIETDRYFVVREYFCSSLLFHLKRASVDSTNLDGKKGKYRSRTKNGNSYTKNFSSSTFRVSFYLRNEKKKTPLSFSVWKKGWTLSLSSTHLHIFLLPLTKNSLICFSTKNTKLYSVMDKQKRWSFLFRVNA